MCGCIRRSGKCRKERARLAEELKERKFLNNFEIEVSGSFKSEYNEVRLHINGHCFPIANAATQSEAIVAIEAYISGFAHGQNTSYVQFCDKD